MVNFSIKFSDPNLENFVMKYVMFQNINIHGEHKNKFPTVLN